MIWSQFINSKYIKSRTISGFLALTIGLLASQSALATKVQFQTVLGDFEVNLYDKTTPKTVENFLAYVNSGAYTNAIFHRSVAGFVVQGGGFKYSGSLPLTAITQNAAVINEPVYSNKRGTIAMAKVQNNPNSATNQWFFNLVDNSALLDSDNGGYTVFGEVTGNGMAILDAIAALGVFQFSSPFESMPLRNYTATDASNNVAPTTANLMLITGIVVLDANADTAANLNPVKNTSSSKSSKSSGGGMDWLGLLLLLGIGYSSYRKRG